MCYVMMSRVQTIDQLIIIDSVNESKLYPSRKAIQELEKMNEKIKGNVYTNMKESVLSVATMNIRTIRKHFNDLVGEPNITENDVICLQQTCLLRNENNQSYNIENFFSHFNSFGEGKGIAVFYSTSFVLKSEICEEKFQLSLLRSENYDIICIYRSTDNTQSGQIAFLSSLGKMVNMRRKQFIIGDFNCEPTGNIVSDEVRQWGFQQLVKNATHIIGRTIDHVYASINIASNRVNLVQKPVYFSDHDFIRFSVV